MPRLALEELLNNCKSAVVIEDPADINRFLEERQQREATARATPMTGPGLPHTHVNQRSDGSVMVSKALPLTEAMVGMGAPATPTGDALKKLFEQRAMPYEPEFEQRCVPYIASDESVDSYGDIVKQEWLFDTFSLNSPMPYSHEWFAPPIGRHIDWQVFQKQSESYQGPALWLLAFFATEEMSERAESIFRLVQSKVLVSGSVGFRSHRIIRVEDDAERAELGLGRWGVILDRNELYEFSPTTLGANRGAHVLPKAAQLRGLRPIDVLTLRETARMDLAETTRSGRDYMALELALLDMGRALFPDLKDAFVPNSDLDQSVFSGPEAARIMRAEVPDEDVADATDKLDAVIAAQEEFATTVVGALNDIKDLIAGQGDDEPEEEPEDGDQPAADPEGDGGEDNPGTDPEMTAESLRQARDRLTAALS